MLLCVGDLMLDILITSGRPSDGMPEGIYVRGGGSAANVAVWSVRSGYPAAWMGVVGTDDLAGDTLLSDLRRQGVLTFPSILPSTETGVVISYVRNGGRRTMHSARWAGSHFRQEHIVLDFVSKATAIHCTGYTISTPPGREAVKEIMRLGKANGALLSLDPSDKHLIRSIGIEQYRGLLMEFGVDVLFPNRSEAKALTEAASPRLAANLLGEIVPIVVVKDGSRGCFASEKGKLLHLTAERQAAVDTTGAGDSFAGAWLANYLQFGDIRAACMVGNRVAGRVVQTIGGRPVDAHASHEQGETE